MPPCRCFHGLWQLLFLVAATLLPSADCKKYADRYSFVADRIECDGQCTYCKHSHNHEKWSTIRDRINRYVYTSDLSGRFLHGVRHEDIQRMIDYSWEYTQNYECLTGVIHLRMLSFAYADPFIFMEDDTGEYTVLDFLDRFNQHTGALDLLQSEFTGLLAGGWPTFRELQLVSLKVKDRMKEPVIRYKYLQAHDNSCDAMDSGQDVRYRRRIVDALRNAGPWPLLGEHFVAMQQGERCPVAHAVTLLSIARELVVNRGMYQGSLKEHDNLVFALISTGQDAIGEWARTKKNWVPYWELLTTEWPLWEILSVLACVHSERACVARSTWLCYDFLLRREVACPHIPAAVAHTFVSCGEHDICTRPPDLDITEWCVPFDRRPPSPRQPWLLELGHDEERRICAQCGQDGIIRAIFDHVGFRNDANAESPPYFVEFGARKPGMLNSASLREFCGWTGLLMDSQPGETPHGGCRDCPGVTELVQKEFVTAENIVGLFRKYDVPHDFELLTIDTDYNDYWLWRALLADGKFRPRLVAVDFNPDIPLDEAKVVEYNATAEWDGSAYTVGSLLAYALMARAHGYTFAYALEMGSHAFFIRTDLVAEVDRDLPLRSVRKMSHMPDLQGRQFEDVLYDFVPSDKVGSNGTSPTAAGSSGGFASGGELRVLQEQVNELLEEVRKLRT